MATHNLLFTNLKHHIVNHLEHYFLIVQIFCELFYDMASCPFSSFILAFVFERRIRQELIRTGYHHIGGNKSGSRCVCISGFPALTIISVSTLHNHSLEFLLSICFWNGLAPIIFEPLFELACWVIEEFSGFWASGIWDMHAREIPV